MQQPINAPFAPCSTPLSPHVFDNANMALGAYPQALRQQPYLGQQQLPGPPGPAGPYGLPSQPYEPQPALSQLMMMPGGFPHHAQQSVPDALGAYVAAGQPLPSQAPNASSLGAGALMPPQLGLGLAAASTPVLQLPDLSLLMSTLVQAAAPHAHGQPHAQQPVAQATASAMYANPSAPSSASGECARAPLRVGAELLCCLDMHACMRTADGSARLGGLTRERDLWWGEVCGPASA